MKYIDKGNKIECNKKEFLKFIRQVEENNKQYEKFTKIAIQYSQESSLITTDVIPILQSCILQLKARKKFPNDSFGLDKLLNDSKIRKVQALVKLLKKVSIIPNKLVTKTNKNK